MPKIWFTVFLNCLPKKNHCASVSGKHGWKIQCPTGFESIFPFTCLLAHNEYKHPPCMLCTVNINQNEQPRTTEHLAQMGWYCVMTAFQYRGLCIFTHTLENSTSDYYHHNNIFLVCIYEMKLIHSFIISPNWLYSFNSVFIHLYLPRIFILPHTVTCDFSFLFLLHFSPQENVQFSMENSKYNCHILF